jgi:sortase A
MRMKKIVLLMLALALVVTIAACGSAGQTGQGGGDEKPEAPKKMPKDAKKEPVAPETGREKNDKARERANVEAPADETLRLTVPKMERIKDVEIPTARGDDEEALRNYHAVHLKYTGFPWEQEANVYIAGHRLGYQGTPSYYAFLDIEKVKKGDEIFVSDANGTEYTYKVYNTMVVGPTELNVLNPVPGKNILTLQACTLPDYTNRIIVQAELTDTQTGDNQA